MLENKVKEKQFLYIVQSSSEPSMCKIGITRDLDRRLKEYNSITGRSKNNVYSYLFACEVKNMREIENDIKENFSHLREQSNREIYFFNEKLLDSYVEFIRSNKNFKKEVVIKNDNEKNIVVKVVKKKSLSLKERELSKQKIINLAKKIKNDEFYTKYEDVEKEISMYPAETWKDKCVFCNCDDAVGGQQTEKDSSAFALYFIRNFKKLGLKKLICTHYSGQIDLFSSGAKGYVFTKNGVKEIVDAPKGYTGSFDDPLSIEILNKEADIVCTNPPFSKALEFWDLVISSGKKFLIIGNEATLLSATFFRYFVSQKVWYGYNSIREFMNPKREIVRAPAFWFTNIEIKNRARSKNLKFMKLSQIPDKYKKFDDNGILVVDRSYIPEGYKKPFAVSTAPILNGLLELGYEISSDSLYMPIIDGKIKFSRVLIKKT